MDLGLTESQQLLQRAARDFLAEQCPSTHVREIEAQKTGLDAAVWQQMADLGWLGLGLPAELGGMDGDATDLAVLAEELGRALAPAPWLSTVVWAGNILTAAGGPEAAELVRKITAGKAVVAVAIREADAGYSPASITAQAVQDGNGWRITGEKLFVQDGADADSLIVVARVGNGTGADGITCFLVDAGSAGLTVERQHSVATVGADLVRLDGVAPVAVLGEVGAGWALLERPTALATAILTVWMLGGAERAIEMTVDYAKTRVQFGRPIGSFQAISHKLADMRRYLDMHRLLGYRAASELAAGAPALAEVSMAKAWANTYTRWSLYRCHEVFAGIGFMNIHDIQLFFRRLKLAESLLGDETHHRQQVFEHGVLAVAG